MISPYPYPDIAYNWLPLGAYANAGPVSSGSIDSSSSYFLLFNFL